jgi:prophage maintenance system killer protein
MNRSDDMDMENGKIVIYQTEDGVTSVDVKFENDTVWLSQGQMAELFQKDRTVITRHINNVFKEGELDKNVVCAKFAHTTQHGAIEGKQQEKEVTLYNLDVIISVGYRVKSKRGTQFRIWASKVLKDYLVKGFVINNKVAVQRYEELSQLVRLLGRTVNTQNQLTTGESKALISVLSDYSYALDTLDRYDYQQLDICEITEKSLFHATYDNAMKVISNLRNQFSNSSLFANPKDDSFKSSIGQIYQTFDGKELYPSVEEKAAMLLYLVTKNHSFTDGNKRIAASLFLWFMDNNGILYNPDGSKRVSDSTIVALTLMIAESHTEEKDTIVKVVVNLINKSN